MRRSMLATVALVLLTTAVAAGLREDLSAATAASAYDRGDYATALQFWRPLADQGNASAQINLGFMYSKGQGVPQNYAEALKWYRRAADQGDASGQYFVGHTYYFGNGVPQNYAEAVKWFRLAANQNYADAQSFIGRMHEGDFIRISKRAAERARRQEPVDKGDEERLSQSWAEALKWHSLAANQGHALSQSSLGSMSRFSDYVLSHMWFNLSAAQGYQPAAKSRDEVAERMTQSQIAEAQKLAREWRPKP